MEGGWNFENVALLLEQGKDIASRLGQCSRVVRTLLPFGK